ncbi:hypothetical protein M011DRAFT_394992 [Sporormia fimetaria CBS 119925]|uniref:Rhodopsin domain-containing protein n=1 Tax=Sporormia fimetaria CBS 119925 TaxID=1340428 RepID=A0A6A6VPE4_9PLEO|nr:hypothetical protein M011DRAFT_394992 [Sporormia fimetaria CBS 119925]
MAAPLADPHSNISNVYIIPVSILLAIALILCVLRLWARATRTKRLYLDDWLIVVAEPLSIINAALAYAAIAHGWGRPMATVSPSDYTSTMKLQFAVQTTWLFTLCLVRLSVACALLRFGRDLLWRITLYFIMGLQVLISSSYVVIQFGQCRPVSANWEFVVNVKCWNVDAIIDYGWAIAAIYIAMDLTLSLLPIKLIRTLNRSRSEKFLISLLMALGLMATAVACAKMTTFTTFGSGDPLQATIAPSMYAKLEEIVGIIATSLPPLKAPIESILKKAGILKEHHLSQPSFVNTAASMQEMPCPVVQPSSSEGSLPVLKDEVQVDSLGIKPSSASSARHTNREKTTWEAV